MHASVFFEEFSSHPGKVVHRKQYIDFFQKWASSCLHCFLPFVARSKKQKFTRGHIFSIFWEVKMGSRVLLRIRGAHFGLGRCVVCGADCVSGEYHGVLKACYTFCVCLSLRGTMRSAISALLEKAAPVIFLVLMPLAAIFSMAKSSSAKRTILVCKLVVNSCVLRQMILVVHGVVS